MRKILVTAISGNVSNGILKALSQSGDLVYGCDVYNYPVGMDKVTDFWKSDWADDPMYIENLLSKCHSYGITHLIPVNEAEICRVSMDIAKFEENGIKVVIQDPFVVETFLDKYNTYCYLKEIKEVYVPQTFTCDNYIEDGKPYIVKLRNSCGSKFLEIIKNKQELDALSLKKEDYVVQEYIDGENEEYTVGMFSNGQKTATIIFKRKLEHGYTSFVELVRDDQIEREAIAIAKNLKLRGFINIQLRRKHGADYIFEINPRISGTVYFRALLNFNDVLWWLDLLDGRPEFEYRCDFKKAIGMRELTEKYVVLERQRSISSK